MYFLGKLSVITYDNYLFYSSPFSSRVIVMNVLSGPKTSPRDLLDMGGGVV